MTEKEIGEAVENLKQCIVENYKDTPVRFSAVDSRDIHALLALAEEYLKIKGWPEEKPVIIGYESKGFNEALHLCKLFAMKKKSKVSREQIEETINLVFIDYALNGQGGRNLTTDLTDALLELINGKEERK